MSIGALIVITIITVRSFNFSQLKITLPEFKPSNYSSSFQEIGSVNPVVQEVYLDYNNLSAVKLRLKLENNFTGAIILHIYDMENPLIELGSSTVEFANLGTTLFHTFKFDPPISGRNFYLVLEAKPQNGIALVGYEPKKDIYPKGAAFFENSKEGDDLVFTTYTQVDLGLLKWVKEDFINHVKSDPVFFLFYIVLVCGLAGVAVVTFQKSTHKESYRKR